MKHARDDYNRIQDPAGKIPENEPVFLLRAQDATAAAVVAYWAELNKDSSPELSELAANHAVLMAHWPKKKMADA